MSDLISRSALIDCIIMIDTSHPYDDKEDILEKVLGAIDYQPIVDAVPVVYGKWIFGKKHDDFVEAKCSVCETLLLVKWYDKLSQYNYCQHCGARMGGE